MPLYDTNSMTKTNISSTMPPTIKQQAPAVVAQHQEAQIGEPPRCTGHAAEALAVFRKRQEELERDGKRQSGMVAYKELNGKYTIKRHGEIPGVPIGLVLQGRCEAAILGIHTRILSGIDGIKDEPCYAICLSGGYEDDDDHSPDGTIIYTGEGGREKNRQVEDQVENASNVSLMRSIDQKIPVRVLRGRKVDTRMVYVYGGLYACVDCSYVPSKDGPKVYKFTLKPIDKGQPRSFQVDYDATRTRGRVTVKKRTGTSRSRLLKNIERLSGKKRTCW